MCMFRLNIVLCFFFNDTATTEIYTLSLHDALPISPCPRPCGASPSAGRRSQSPAGRGERRSEEHTSELQSRSDLVCRLLLEKKNNDRLPTGAAAPRPAYAGGSTPRRTLFYKAGADPVTYALPPPRSLRVRNQRQAGGN